MVDEGAVVIRRAEATDAEALAELGSRTFRDAFAASNRPEDMAEYLLGAFGPARQRAEIVAPGGTTLLVEVDGVAVAFAQLRAGAPPAGVVVVGSVELWRFYVDRAWHGRGVAQHLMRAVLAEAEALGGQSVWLGVWEHNARAVAFYGKFGFTVVGAQEFRLGRDVQTDRIMVLANLPGRALTG